MWTTSLSRKNSTGEKKYDYGHPVDEEREENDDDAADDVEDGE